MSVFLLLVVVGAVPDDLLLSVARIFKGHGSIDLANNLGRMVISDYSTRELIDAFTSARDTLCLACDEPHFCWGVAVCDSRITSVLGTTSNVDVAMRRIHVFEKNIRRSQVKKAIALMKARRSMSIGQRMLFNEMLYLNDGKWTYEPQQVRDIDETEERGV